MPKKYLETEMGNKYRLDKNESTIELEKFLKWQVTKNFISTLMELNNCERNDIIKVVARGAITYANLQFLIYCAIQLSTKFQVHVINKFIYFHFLSPNLSSNTYIQVKKLDRWVVMI